MKGRIVLAALAVALGGAAIVPPVSADYRKVVDGLVINVGVVPAASLLRADPYERAMHRDADSQAAPVTQATHHVVVGVADEKSSTPVGDARVTLEIIDPHGGVQRRVLERGNAGGVPDYSGLVRFGWSGDYRLRVNVARAGAAPVTSTFTWSQNY